MQATYYNLSELRDMGFITIGQDVKVARTVRIYGATQMRLGSHVRIEDGTVLSGPITMGDYTHIAPHCTLIAAQGAEITFADFASISANVSLYAKAEDYSGETLTNPTVPDLYAGRVEAPIKLGKHVIVGAGAVVLPGVTLGDYGAVGALSLVKKDTEPYGIYAGTPVRKVGERSPKLQELEAKVRASPDL